MLKKLTTVFVVFASMFGAMAEVPSLINYQGKLSDNDGAPVNGDKNFTVRIFDTNEGGNQVYEEEIGTVSVKDGLYSFGFGEAGQSILDFSERLVVQEEGKQIFDFTLGKTPVEGSLSVTAGQWTWDETGGSSNSGEMIVNYDKTNKSAKIIFLNSSPAKDAALEFDYRITDEGVLGGLSSAKSSWLEIAVGGETLSPRERLVSVPFALKAKTALNVINQAKSIVGYDQMRLVAGYSLQNGNAWPPKINFRSGLSGPDYLKTFYLTPGKVEVEIYVTGAHLYAGNEREEYIKNLHIGVTLENINPHPFRAADINARHHKLSKKAEELIDAANPGSRPAIKKSFIGDIPIGGIYRISFQSKPYYLKDSQRIYLDVIYGLSIK